MRFAGCVQLLLGGSMLGLASCEFASETPEPNLILIIVDTLRADHTSLHGYELPTTPRLDAFAAEHGVVFEQARSTSSWTKPSVASVFTGLDPRQHRVQRHMDALHSSYTTLAQTLGEAGWQTHGVQSNPYLLSVFGFDKGFVHYEDELLSQDPEGTIASYDRSTGRNVNARALEWLDTRDAGLPFFLYVHHYEPHHMYLERESSFMPDAQEEPSSLRRTQLSEASMDVLSAGASKLTVADANFLAALYDSELLYQDRLLGELFAGLERRGLLANSIVVVTSDHGEEFLEHGDVSHHNDKLFDELLHVPLVIAVPDGTPARRAQAVSLIDLGRTLLDLCGLSTADFPGESFEGLLFGTPPKDRNADIVAHGLWGGADRDSYLGNGVEALVVGRWKLIRDLWPNGDLQLFDLELDPGELVDLSSREAERVAELEQRLAGYLVRRGGIGPEPPEESAEVLRRRYLRLFELEDELKKLGY